MTEETAQNYELEPLLQAYRAATPKDPASAEDLRQTIKELFPGATEAGSDPTAPERNDRVTKARENDRDAARDAWRECRYGKEIVRVYSRGSTPEDARRAYLERKAEIEAMDETGTHTESGEGPVNLFEAGSSIRAQGKSQAKTPAPAVQQSVERPPTETKRDASDDNMRIKDAHEIRQQQLEEPPSIFGEFAQAWQRTNAFSKRKSGKRHGRGRTLNVLGWAFGG